MDLERVLISKIITTGRLEDAISKGVMADHFADDECREMFIYLSDYARRYKSPPSEDAVKEDRPKFEWEHISEPLEWVIDKFVILVKRRLANEMVVELAKACDDEDRAENIDLEFLEVSRKLATIVPSTQVRRFKADMDKRIDDYERRARDREKIGIQFGFDPLDAWTGGIQPHEFVTVSGFSGLGKSTFLMAVAFNVWAQGKTPLYVSLEMEANSILRKFDAMAASLDYQRMKQLDLPPDQIANWREKREEIQAHVSEIPVIDSIRHCSPEHVFAETVRHKPDLVVIDYLSLMRSSRPNRNSSLWQSLTEITQDLKQNARTLAVPIMAAAQTNRSGGKDGAELDNIGYSISVIQDSDIVIGLFADDEMKADKRMQIRLNKNRDGKIDKFDALWDHDNMSFRALTFQDRFGKAGDK